MPHWYVYILRSLSTPYLYIGSTSDLHRRLFQHNNGLVRSTKLYLPLQVAAYIAVSTETQTRTLEKYFKTGSGKAILKKSILMDRTVAQV